MYSIEIFWISITLIRNKNVKGINKLKVYIFEYNIIEQEKSR